MVLYPILLKYPAIREKFCVSNPAFRYGSVGMCGIESNMDEIPIRLLVPEE